MFGKYHVCSWPFWWRWWRCQGRSAESPVMRIADTRAAGKVLYLRKGTMMVVVMMMTMTMTMTIMLTMMIMFGVFTFDASFCWTARNVIYYCVFVWKKSKVEKQTQILKQVQVCWVYLSSDCYLSIAHSRQKLTPAWTRLAMSPAAIKQIFTLKIFGQQEWKKHDEYCGCLQCMTSSTLGKIFFQLK